jgi:hypothetical protein
VPEGSLEALLLVARSGTIGSTAIVVRVPTFDRSLEDVAMPKRTTGQRSPKGDDFTLRVKRGEKIEFPVPSKHPLARFQTLTPVRSSDDISDFLRLWEQVAARKDQPPVAPSTAVSQLKKQKTKVLRIAAHDLHIAKGAVVTLNNPLNELECDGVTVAGDLVSQGELVLKCETLNVE